jgi:hypothetical protein
LRQLLRIGRVSIDESSFELLYALLDNLANPELTESLLEFEVSKSKLNSSNCISRFKAKSLYHIDNSREKSFIALHFCELQQSSIQSLEPSDLEQILSDESLQIESEDSLLVLLISRIKLFESSRICSFRALEPRWHRLIHLTDVVFID